MPRLIVAIEGPSRAGKSVLVQALLRSTCDYSVIAVPCFSEFAGGGSLLPSFVPKTASDRLAAVESLARLDNRRTALARASAADVILLDRSHYSLLAHSFAFERLLGEPMLDASETIIRDVGCLEPDMIIYVETSFALRRQRGLGLFSPTNPHLGGPVQDLARDYFRGAGGVRVPVEYVQGDSADEALAAAREIIARHLQSDSRPGTRWSSS